MKKTKAKPIGRTIRLCRQYNGLTQTELGKMLGFPKNSAGIRIGQYEKERSIAKSPIKEKLAKLLGIHKFAISRLSVDSELETLHTLFKIDMLYGLNWSKNGNTVCLSTQIGCKMGCVFCASGMDGFKRNLLASEILGQAVAINRMEGGTAKERAVTNIVLMGSGEPLDNYDNVLRFLSDATRKDGINFSERNISLSTSGLCDRIRDLADSGFKITLSISLHGADDSIRSSIMPVNRRYGVKEVIGAARYYFERTGRRVIFEYILIDGVNDSRADAVKLAALVKGFPAHINVIRYNEVDGKSMKSPSVRSTEDFVAGLNALGASATLRHSFGGDIEGACGQLKRRYTTEAGK